MEDNQDSDQFGWCYAPGRPLSEVFWPVLDLWRSERDEYWSKDKSETQNGTEELVQIKNIAKQLHESMKNLADIDAVGFSLIHIDKELSPAVWEELQMLLAEDSVLQLGTAEDRFFHLLALIRDFSPTYKARPYLVRASNCYLLKLDIECVILCRSALEQELISRVSNDDCHEIFGDRRARHDGSSPCDVYERIAAAKQKAILDDECVEKAHEVRNVANRVVHKYARFANEGKNWAFVVLKNTLDVMQALQ